MHRFYTVLDIASIVVILMILRSSIKRTDKELGQRFFQGGNKVKKFEVAKASSVKFKDVAGMEESKR